MISPQKRLSRFLGAPSAVVLGVFVIGAGVAGASSSAHSPRSTHVEAPRLATSVQNDPRPNECSDVGGDATGLTSSAITVLNRDGTSSTYAVSSSTTVTKDRSPSMLAALALGDNVHITVSSVDAGSASSIDIVPADVAGRVTAVSASTISVAGPHGRTGTIDVTNATTFAKSGVAASLSDVTVGSFVFAKGTFGATSTTIEAASVGIGQPSSGPGPGPGPGRDAGAGPDGRPFAPLPS